MPYAKNGDSLFSFSQNVQNIKKTGLVKINAKDKFC